MNKVFDFPQFAEIRKGIFKWYAPVQEADDTHIRVDVFQLPEHVPNIYYIEELNGEISKDVMKSFKSTDGFQRTYSNGDYKIFITSL